jgi:tRNA dimethylallyltransferase
MRHAVIVAGPTCSGKSALALGLAQRLGGTVINADSMQVYRELRLLTARPSEVEEAMVPHRLYGVRPAAEAGSVAWWRAAALAEMEASNVPILCGGTGLYFASLTQGLTEIPEPVPEARAEARDRLATLGPAALHAALAAVDPESATRLNPADSQRIARAWEVWRSTGRSLTQWQRSSATPAPWRFTVLRLDPPRESLRTAIAARFAGMLAKGAVAEVEALLAQNLDPGLPAMRALGVPELSAYLLGEMSLAEAEARAVLASGQYIKRQATWFRHRSLAAPERTHIIHARIAGLEQFSEREWADLINFIQSGG